MKKSINVTSDNNRLDININANKKALSIYLADFTNTDEVKTSIFLSACRNGGSTCKCVYTYIYMTTES